MNRHRHSLALSCLLTALAVGGWTPLGAQTLRVPPAHPHPACFDSIPPSAFSRVVVLAMIRADGDSTLSEATSHPILSSADALLQGLVERVRRRLGAADDRLPRGEPVLGDSTHVWRAVGSDLALTAHRDGRLVARIDSTSPDSGAAALFRSALVEAGGAGESFIWPVDGAAAALDSVKLRVELVSVAVDSAGRAHTPTYRRPAVPVFTMLVPWEEPVLPRKVPRPVYPVVARQNGFLASVTLQFVVNEDGRADMATLRDVHAAQVARLSDELWQPYQAFVRATRESVERARFTPARIGGCRVRQLVQLPFTYELR